MPVYTETPCLQVVEECDEQQEKLETCLVSLSVKSLKNSIEKYGKYADAFIERIGNN